MRTCRYRLMGALNVVAVMVLVSVGIAQASRKPFAHYAPILDRRPFGVGAPPPAVEAPAVEAPPDFTQHLKLVALRDGASGIRVGLVDPRARPPQSYMLPLGATEDGLTVVDVDFEGGRALVRKDGLQGWISMREDRDAAAATAAAGKAGTDGAQAAGVESSAANLSYAERRRQRQERLEAMRARVREPEPETPAPTTATDQAEIDRQLQEYQMSLIRAGRTPLPIPLSAEADAQLVAEGVLPPQSER